MIDFRYHVVSIVSIFMALAVGIVLGAGPLQGQLGEALNKEVAKLRGEKSQLRSQLDAADLAAQANGAFADSIRGTIAADRLQGQAVVILQLPGSQKSEGEAMREAVASAGANDAGLVRLGAAWGESKEAKRARLAALATKLAVPAPSEDEDPDRFLATLVSRTLVVAGPSSILKPAEITPSERLRMVDALVESEVIEVEGDRPTAATEAVVMTGSELDPSEQDTTARLVLTQVLDRASRGTVVAGDSGDLLLQSPLIAAVRADEAAIRSVSTVDNAALPVGRIAVVLALAEQLVGGAGQYGVADRADREFPEPSVGQS